MLDDHVLLQHFNLLIQMSKRWKKNPRFYDIFQLEKDKSKINKLARAVVDNYVSTFFISCNFCS